MRHSPDAVAEASRPEHAGPLPLFHTTRWTPTFSGQALVGRVVLSALLREFSFAARAIDKRSTVSCKPQIDILYTNDFTYLGQEMVQHTKFICMLVIVHLEDFMNKERLCQNHQYGALNITAILPRNHLF